MPFLRFTEERGYIVRGAENMDQYLNVSSCNLPALSSEFVPFDERFDRLHVYSHLDYWVIDTISERRLRAGGYSCCFINLHCFYIYAVTPLVHSGLFVPVSYWRRCNQCSRLWLVSTPISYGVLLESGNKSTDTEVQISYCNLRIFCSSSYFFSAHFRGPIGFISDFTGAVDIAARAVPLPFPEGIHKLMRSVGFSGSYLIVLSIPWRPLLSITE